MKPNHNREKKGMRFALGGGKKKLEEEKAQMKKGGRPAFPGGEAPVKVTIEQEL